MSERKVLNKYYPPDFDPSKIPRAKCPKNRQFTVRLMAPCNMKCLTCGEYIAKAKKFNARKEDVEDKSYLGIRIYRFYIKCPGCLSEISFRTDPETTDYVIEAGAHRNFQALKLAEEQAEREEREAREEIESNPMLLLENRTQQSQHEMEVLESLEDLRELSARHAGLDLKKMTDMYEEQRKLTKEQQGELERLEALKALGYEVIEGQLIKRLVRESDLDSIQLSNKRSRLEHDGVMVPPKLPASETKDNLRKKLAGVVKVSSKTSVIGQVKVPSESISEVCGAPSGETTNGNSAVPVLESEINRSKSGLTCDHGTTTVAEGPPSFQPVILSDRAVSVIRGTVSEPVKRDSCSLKLLNAYGSDSESSEEG